MVDPRIKDIHLADIAVIFDDKMRSGHQVKLSSLDIAVRDIDLNEKLFMSILSAWSTLIMYRAPTNTAKIPLKANLPCQSGWLIDVEKSQSENGQFGIHDHIKERTHTLEEDLSLTGLTWTVFIWMHKNSADSVMAVDIKTIGCAF